MELDKSILLQKQVKDNSQDLRNEFLDMKNWEQQMKRKDEELRCQKDDRVLPPIRSKKKKKPQKTEATQKEDANMTKRIKSYDYNLWDKFDVEKACKEVDKDDGSEESGEEPLSKEELEKNHEVATKHKDQGNIFVKEKKWTKAVACYTEAIKVFPYDAVFYANRALCYLKIDNLYSAESDCSTALQLDETYVKAYHRRATARMELKQYKEARQDLEKILKLEPSNKEAKTMLAQVNKKIEQSKPVIITGEDLNDETPIEKKIGEKICVSPKIDKQVNNIREKEENVAVEVKNVRTKLDPRIPEWLPERNNVGIVEPIVKPPHLRSKEPFKNIAVKDMEFGIIEHREKIKENIIKHNLEIKSTEKSQKVLEQKNTFTLPSESAEMPTIPPPPKTAVQFLMDWKRNNSSDFRYAYLKQIPAGNISNIFQDSMESDIFSEILSVLKSECPKNNNPVYRYLKDLSEVKRFRALIMFISNKDKEALQDLFDYCRSTENVPEEDISCLRTVYEI